MKYPRTTIAVLWLLWSVFGTLVLCVFATSPRVNKLQSAGSAQSAKVIIDGWEASGQTTTARKNMTFDYLFVLTFYPCLTLAALFFTRERWTFMGRLFAGAATVAGLCDLIEDVALELVWRNPGGADTAARVAASVSAPKVVLGVVSLLFVIAALLALLLREDRVQRHHDRQ